MDEEVWTGRSHHVCIQETVAFVLLRNWHSESPDSRRLVPGEESPLEPFRKAWLGAHGLGVPHGLEPECPPSSALLGGALEGACMVGHCGQLAVYVGWSEGVGSVQL